jgi:hypothetical protein
MFSRGTLIQALNRRAARKCLEAVGADGLRDREAGEEFVKLVREAEQA